ncbi:LysR family transcriptional regulator [Aureibacillus halotolerans]|uniref:DNA-binding transcriptional LysR family regulator n=1 Tax=Aureibacillus halotolerans TaxID=1508390 RepID=A0A4R6U784_9BACI|nr:LysR family transcriptional regulator [Aureibacillus halotolerans]TDQ40753.1 DNA-binding transcriptional LysR family regulator [Aureibacillus halotolerans]
MEFTYMKTFLEVEKQGSYTNAASTLGYAQSSVTAHIQKLEAAYGIVLFERFGRNMRLTSAGRLLLPYAQDIVRLHKESLEKVAGQTNGSISIGTVESVAAFYLPAFLQAFRNNWPHVSISVEPLQEKQILAAIKNGTLDIGFILDPPGVHEGLQCVQLRREPLMIVTRPDHRFKDKQELTVFDLDNEPLILTEEGCTYRAMLLQGMAEANVRCVISYELGSLHAMKQSIQQGSGVALLPQMVVEEELQQHRLIATPYVHPMNHFYIQMVYAKNKWVSDALRAFLDMFPPEPIDQTDGMYQKE